MRIVIAFVPVDDENSVLIMYIYQGFMKMSGLKQLVDWINIKFSLKIAHQDRRVVETQIPKPSGLSIGENLFQGDNPIIAYRNRRAQLIKKAATKVV